MCGSRRERFGSVLRDETGPCEDGSLRRAGAAEDDDERPTMQPQVSSTDVSSLGVENPTGQSADVKTPTAVGGRDADPGVPFGSRAGEG